MFALSLHQNQLVIVHDLDIVRVPRSPGETDSPAVIDADAVQTGAATPQPLQPVAAKSSGIGEAGGRFQPTQPLRACSSIPQNFRLLTHSAIALDRSGFDAELDRAPHPQRRRLLKYSNTIGSTEISTIPYTNFSKCARTTGQPPIQYPAIVNASTQPAPPKTLNDKNLE